MKQEIIKFRNTEIDLEFDFSIYGYAFSDTACSASANWLVVSMECRYQGKKFMKTDSSVETYDLQDICKWFKSISCNTIPKYTYLGFTEPNLEFQIFGNKSGKIRFGIKLDAEFKPPFYIREFAIEPVESDDEFVMVFENSLQEIEDYSASFQSLLDSFPHRANR